MIRFKNVSLTLGNKQLLDHFNLTIADGEKIVISAPSGARKSSLLKLLLGFFEADPGAWFTESADGPTAEQIEALIAERAAAKKAKNYARADEIRDQLAAKGVILEDGPDGVKWRRA